MVSSFSVEDATRSARMVVALGHFTEISWNICCRMVVSTATRIGCAVQTSFRTFRSDLFRSDHWCHMMPPLRLKIPLFHSWAQLVLRAAQSGTGKDPHNAGQSAFGAKDDVMMCRTKDPYRFQKQVPKTGSKNRFHTQISAEQIIAVFFLVLQATCRLSRRCRDFRVPRCHSFWWRCYMCRPRLTIQHRKCCAGHMPPHIINVNDTRQPWQLLHGLATLLLLLGIQVSCGGIHIMSASRVKACNLDKGHRLCRCANLFFTSQTHWIYLSTSCFFKI